MSLINLEQKDLEQINCKYKCKIFNSDSFLQSVEHHLAHLEENDHILPLLNESVEDVIFKNEVELNFSEIGKVFVHSNQNAFPIDITKLFKSHFEPFFNMRYLAEQFLDEQQLYDALQQFEIELLTDNCSEFLFMCQDNFALFEHSNRDLDCFLNSETMHFSVQNTERHNNNQKIKMIFNRPFFCIAIFAELRAIYFRKKRIDQEMFNYLKPLFDELCHGQQYELDLEKIDYEELFKMEKGIFFAKTINAFLHSWSAESFEHFNERNDNLFHQLRISSWNIEYRDDSTVMSRLWTWFLGHDAENIEGNQEVIAAPPEQDEKSYAAEKYASFRDSIDKITSVLRYTMLNPSENSTLKTHSAKFAENVADIMKHGESYLIDYKEKMEEVLQKLKQMIAEKTDISNLIYSNTFPIVQMLAQYVSVRDSRQTSHEAGTASLPSVAQQQTLLPAPLQQIPASIQSAPQQQTLLPAPTQQNAASIQSAPQEGGAVVGPLQMPDQQESALVPDAPLQIPDQQHALRTDENAHSLPLGGAQRKLFYDFVKEHINRFQKWAKKNYKPPILTEISHASSSQNQNKTLQIENGENLQLDQQDERKKLADELKKQKKTVRFMLERDTRVAGIMAEVFQDKKGSRVLLEQPHPNPSEDSAHSKTSQVKSDSGEIFAQSFGLNLLQDFLQDAVQSMRLSSVNSSRILEFELHSPEYCEPHHNILQISHQKNALQIQADFPITRQFKTRQKQARDNKTLLQQAFVIFFLQTIQNMQLQNKKELNGYDLWNLISYLYSAPFIFNYKENKFEYNQFKTILKNAIVNDYNFNEIWKNMLTYNTKSTEAHLLKLCFSGFCYGVIKYQVILC